MAKIDLPYVNAQRDRARHAVYWYFRRNGRRWRLPPLHDPEFMAVYRQLLAATEPSPHKRGEGLLPGSFGALAADYLASPEFRATRPNTQRLYRMVLEPLAELHRDKPVKLLERRHIKAWRDARSETPGMANMVVKITRLLLAYAVDNEWRRDNPAQRIKLFKLGEHRAWTDAECAAFEARWPVGSMQRRAFTIARFTGQRCGDIAGMTRAHRKDGFIRVLQEKTGTDLWIFEHSKLAAELALGGAHMSLLTTEIGKAFEPANLGVWFADAIEKAGLPDACVMHGLRKAAATMLAEVGCSTLEIMSITGHRSLAEIERYTRAANQKTLATAAIHRLEQNTKRTRSGKRLPRPSGKQEPTG